MPSFVIIDENSSHNRNKDLSRNIASKGSCCNLDDVVARVMLADCFGVVTKQCQHYLSFDFSREICSELHIRNKKLIALVSCNQNRFQDGLSTSACFTLCSRLSLRDDCGCCIVSCGCSDCTALLACLPDSTRDGEFPAS